MSAEFGRSAIVAGAGPVGLVAALALAREAVAVTLAGETSENSSGRTVALFDHSIRLLTELGVWQGLAKDAAPLRTLRIIDDTDNLFRWRPLTFEAREIGLDAFGWNIEAGALNAALRRVAETVPAIHLIDGFAAEPFFDADRAGCVVGGRRLEAELIVAADGQRSRLREAAGITARLERLPQWALTGIFHHELPHEDISTEFHTREGPCTLVPLPPLRSGPDSEASSLVWMVRSAKARTLKALDDEAFLARRRAAHAFDARQDAPCERARRGAALHRACDVDSRAAPRPCR